jgi:hypothetical protein
MKINIFVSVIKSISAWLHGEGGKHFRTYTYPRLKNITRKYIDLGIYEKVESFYKVVDDTFYNGVIPEHAQNPLEVANLEQLVDKVESETETDAATDSGALPKFKDIRDKLLIWKGLEQGNTYKCGTYTMNNMLRTAMLMAGLKPPLEVTAIDPLYVETKYGPGKEGTVMDFAFAWLRDNGFPIPSWTPLMTDHNKELDALENSKTVRNAKLFPSIKATGKTKTVYTYDQAKALDETLPSNWLMQVSIDFNASLVYFGEIVPYLKKLSDGKYSLIRTGGHSIHGVRGSFSTWEDGESGFAIIESAYRSREEGWRFIKSNFFLYGMLSVRFVEFNLSGVTPVPVQPNPEPIEDDLTILAMNNIAFGDKGRNVIALQNYLIKSGHSIPAGATGNFLEQTKTALKAWQDKHFGPKFKGDYWGEISRAKLVELERLG